jgi:hypothetical protein
MPRMKLDRSAGLRQSLIWAHDMFLDKKEAMPQASMQCGLKKSASPDRHGVDEMIFVTDVEIAYRLVCTLE